MMKEKMRAIMNLQHSVSVSLIVAQVAQGSVILSVVDATCANNPME
jgi:hypothetical protein